MATLPQLCDMELKTNPMSYLRTVNFDNLSSVACRLFDLKVRVEPLQLGHSAFSWDCKCVWLVSERQGFTRRADIVMWHHQNRVGVQPLHFGRASINQRLGIKPRVLRGGYVDKQ